MEQHDGAELETKREYFNTHSMLCTITALQPLKKKPSTLVTRVGIYGNANLDAE